MAKNARIRVAILLAGITLSSICSAAGCVQPRRAVLDGIRTMQAAIPNVPPHVAQYLEGEEKRILDKSAGAESARRAAFNKLYAHESYGPWKAEGLLQRIIISAQDFPDTATPTLQESSLALISSHNALANGGDLRSAIEDLLARDIVADARASRVAMTGLRTALLDYSNCLAVDLLAWQLRQK